MVGGNVYVSTAMFCTTTGWISRNVKLNCSDRTRNLTVTNDMYVNFMFDICLTVRL
jgi:hypothetical protein